MVTSAQTVLAAIDIGTNAVRLKLARPLPDGSLETLYQERDPIRPGEGVFETGSMPPATVKRLVSTLSRFAAQCRRYRASVRAVATSALRTAKNQEQVLARVRREAGLEIDVVSGKEEARLICLGVLQDQADDSRSLCLDIGGGSTEVAIAEGRRPRQLYSATLGAVRFSETFSAQGRVTHATVEVMREYAQEVLDEAIPRKVSTGLRHALGSSGTIQAVVSFASKGKDTATLGQLVDAVEALVELGPAGRRKHFEARRADVIIAGAVILETVVKHLRLKSVRAVEQGLRDGILLDLLQRGGVNRDDRPLAEAAAGIGRRFDYDERHAQQVAKLALTLFDSLDSVHQLPRSARAYLQVAALLHDIGSSVNYEGHHKHTQYLIHHADLPGLSDHERDLVGRIARYHRRSAPELEHSGMVGLTPSEAKLVRKSATLLRLADALDRSHHQPVRSLRVRAKSSAVQVSLKGRGPVDLELWDAERETALFQRVFGRRLDLSAGR
ncbi:MAG: Ppx/GppA phosphatase family protein [Myxococcaceae bacterium]